MNGPPQPNPYQPSANLAPSSNSFSPESISSKHGLATGLFVTGILLFILAFASNAVTVLPAREPSISLATSFLLFVSGVCFLLGFRFAGRSAC